MASSNPFSQLSTNFLDVSSAYEYYKQLCDDPTRRDVALTTSAIALFIIYGLGIVSQAVVLPANWRLSEQRSAFLLLLYINIFDLIWLFEYVWLSLEYLVGVRIQSKYPLGAYIFRFVNFCIDTFYIELAFNRCAAFLFPRIYNVICSQKNMKLCVLSTYCLAIVYSIYMNWFKERRPFHCLMQLGYFEPMTSIPKNVTALLPDAAFYDAVQIAEVVSICMPLFFYAITVFKMVLNFKQHHSSSTVQIAIVLPVGSQTNQEDRAKFVNLMQERTRLFSMCLLSQVPYYMSHALYQSSRILQLNANTVQILAIFWQLLGTIFHVQQPILMLLLSKDMRSSVRKDLEIFWNWLTEII
uniref:G protein-coupled receptor n=1 Tax=Globodera rostochiensis TaxID=31243 RepID=A0A914I0B7_GLORO